MERLARSRCNGSGNFVYTVYPNVDVGCSNSSPQCLNKRFSIGIYSGLRQIPKLEEEAFEVFGFH
jgi:hypothetical protein